MGRSGRRRGARKVLIGGSFVDLDQTQRRPALRKSPCFARVDSMRVLDIIMWPFHALADRIALRRRLARFTCADCERHDHCGMPPDDLCIARLAQIERFGDTPRPRPFVRQFSP